MHSITHSALQSQPFVDEKLKFDRKVSEFIGDLKSRHAYNFAQKVVRARTENGSGHATAHGEPVPLVLKSKSHRSHLPPYFSVPSSPTRCYQVYRRDLYVCRSNGPTILHENDISPRCEITEFSKKSRRSLQHIARNSEIPIQSQFCLTYHLKPPTDGRQIKADLDAWLKCYRRLCPLAGYLWVLEFQKRGAPHFHVFLTVPPSRELQEQLARAWVRITEGNEFQFSFHNHPNNFFKWSMQDGSYVCKYVDKVQQKDVPTEFLNVGRFWGCSRNMSPVARVVTVENLAKLTRNHAIPWDATSISLYFNKCFRRYHEHLLKKHKKRKSPLAKTFDGAVRIPNGAALFFQLLDYVSLTCPDKWSFAASVREKIPF